MDICHNMIEHFYRYMICIFRHIGLGRSRYTLNEIDFRTVHIRNRNHFIAQKSFRASSLRQCLEEQRRAALLQKSNVQKSSLEVYRTLGDTLGDNVHTYGDTLGDKSNTQNANIQAYRNCLWSAHGGVICTLCTWWCEVLRRTFVNVHLPQVVANNTHTKACYLCRRENANRDSAFFSTFSFQIAHLL